MRQRCDGCDHNHYTAPHGQSGRPEPHSRCRFFNAYIPMNVDKQGNYLDSVIPPGCPTYSQKELFA